jgi:HAD superfamily hydrolase (TIGR01490 family)
MNLALFDFDGTLTTRETFGDFIRFAAPPRRRLAGAPLFAPMLALYKLGLVSGTRIRHAVVSFALRGVSSDALQCAGERYAAEVLPGMLRAEAMQRLAGHQAQGDRVVLVSGGLDAYLAPWCRQHGIELLCSTLESRTGRLTGRYVGAQCVGEEKARRVRAHLDLAAYPSCHAYGDTPEDEAMLALARHVVYRGQPRH